MKSTGIVRKVDELGRVVIPKELRRTLDIKEIEDSMEIFTDGDLIILKKYAPSCIFCGQANDIIFFKSKRICKECLKNIKENK